MVGSCKNLAVSWASDFPKDSKKPSRRLCTETAVGIPIAWLGFEACQDQEGMVLGA